MKMAAIQWPLFGRCLFVTLTYPAAFPVDGRVVAYHRDRFHRQLVRRWGKVPAAWVREFHERGAAHNHLCVGVGKVSERKFRAWAKAEWNSIVARPWVSDGVVMWGGLDDVDREGHRDQGVFTEVSRANPAAYFAGYVGDQGRVKGYQHVVPGGHEAPGRWWGLWDVEIEWRCVDVSRENFWLAVQLVRMRRAAQGLNLPPSVSEQGQWIRLPGESALLAFVQECRRLDEDVGGGGERSPVGAAVDRAVPVGC
jgi:hypothetical protein